MDESILQMMRKANRQDMHQIWEHAKNGTLNILSDEYRQLGEIMLEHQDEFFHEFEFADLHDDYEYDPETEVNPFMHITMHQIIENQMRAKDPIEVYQLFNAIRKQKISRHDTIHLLANIFIHFLFPALKHETEFDTEGYRVRLKRYMLKKYDRMLADLDRE